MNISSTPARSPFAAANKPASQNRAVRTESSAPASSEEDYWVGSVHFLPKSERLYECNAEFGAIDYSLEPTQIALFGIAGAGIGGLVGAALGSGWTGAAVGAAALGGLYAAGNKLNGRYVITDSWGLG